VVTVKMDFTMVTTTTIVDIYYILIVVYVVRRNVHHVYHMKVAIPVQMVDIYVNAKLKINLTDSVTLVTAANMAVIVKEAVQLVVKITPVISIPGRVNVHSIFKVIIVIAA
jgi:hypothetical protein